MFRATAAAQLLPSSRIVLLTWTGQLEKEAQELSFLVDSPPVISAVIARRHSRLTGPELASKISVDLPSNSTWISVHVTDPGRGTAVTLARAVTARFSAVVRGESLGPGALRIAISRRTPVLRVGPSRVLGALVGAGCGLIAAALLALTRWRNALFPGPGGRTA